MSSHSVPMAGAVQGVAGAISTSTSAQPAATWRANQRRTRCACVTQAAGSSAPARKRSRDSGSKSSGRVFRSSRCSAEPSAWLMRKAAARARSTCGQCTVRVAPRAAATAATAARASGSAMSSNQPPSTPKRRPSMRPSVATVGSKGRGTQAGSAASAPCIVS